MADKRHSIAIQSIYCGGSSEGSDDLFLIYQADAGVPVRFPLKGNVKMSKGKTWEPELVLEFDHEVLLTLWDQDSKTGVNKPDFLMNVEYRANFISSPVTVENDNGAKYTVTAGNFTTQQAQSKEAANV